QRADDLVHVAARAEIAAGAVDDNAFYFPGNRAEEIPQLRVGVEGQGILLFRAIEGNDADLAFDAPAEMLGAHDRTSTTWLFILASSLRSSSCSRRERPAS